MDLFSSSYSNKYVTYEVFLNYWNYGVYMAFDIENPLMNLNLISLSLFILNTEIFIFMGVFREKRWFENGWELSSETGKRLLQKSKAFCCWSLRKKISL